MNKQKKNGQINIAMLGHKRIPSREGGIEIVVEELSTRMVNLGYSVTCYKGVKLKRVFTIEKKVFASLRAAFGPCDVVHYHAERPCAKRCISTIHGIDWQREKWKQGFASKYIHFGEKVAVKYADEIVVLNKGVQEYFQDTYGREMRFIPNG